jgi:hypothetical protein
MGTATETIEVISQEPDLELSPVTVSMSKPLVDPYALQARYLPPEQIQTLRRRGIRRKVRKFYEEQNANIERMLKSVDEHRLAADIAHEEKQLKVDFSSR